MLRNSNRIIKLLLLLEAGEFLLLVLFIGLCCLGKLFW